MIHAGTSPGRMRVGSWGSSGRRLGGGGMDEVEEEGLLSGSGIRVGGTRSSSMNREGQAEEGRRGGGVEDGEQ